LLKDQWVIEEIRQEGGQKKIPRIKWKHNGDFHTQKDSANGSL
jgi:hypothetical protein